MKQTVKDLLSLDFEDLYLALLRKEIYLKKDWRLVEKIELTDEQVEDIKNSILTQDKFSYSIESWKYFYRIAKNWDNMVIRKLWFTFDFYKNYRTDPFLMSFVSEVLTQRDNKTLLVSGLTWSWKTTFLLSLLEMLNNYNYNKIVKEQALKFTEGILKEKGIEMEIKLENLETIIADNFNDKEKELLSFSLNNFLEQIKIKELLDRFNKKAVYTIEKPIEFVFKDWKDLIFFQNEVDTTTPEIADKNYIRLLDLALQSNPDIVYISEIKNKVEYERFVDSVYVWPVIIASNHANNVFQNLKRIESITTNVEEIKSKISMWLWWLINMRRREVTTNDNKNIMLFSYELLKMFKEDVKVAYAWNSNEVFINKMLIENRNSDYYVSHETSLLYNIYLLFLKWKHFKLKEISEKKLLEILNNNYTDLKELYKLSEEKFTFLKNRIMEEYSTLQ